MSVPLHHRKAGKSVGDQQHSALQGAVERSQEEGGPGGRRKAAPAGARLLPGEEPGAQTNRRL